MASACHRCGAPLPEGTRFCPQCGARIDTPEAPVTEPSVAHVLDAFVRVLATVFAVCLTLIAASTVFVGACALLIASSTGGAELGIITLIAMGVFVACIFGIRALRNMLERMRKEKDEENKS